LNGKWHGLAEARAVNLTVQVLERR